MMTFAYCSTLYLFYNRTFLPSKCRKDPAEYNYLLCQTIFCQILGFYHCRFCGFSCRAVNEYVFVLHDDFPLKGLISSYCILLIIVHYRNLQCMKLDRNQK